MLASDSTYNAIKEAIDEFEIVDTHEHLFPEQDWINRDDRMTDFSVFFQHYASVDVISAGLPARDMDAIRGSELSLDEKWEKFEPYWVKARNTSYCKAVDRAIKDLYGLEGLSRVTYAQLAGRMREAKKPGWFRTVLKEKAHIDKSVVNIGRYDVDREFFAPVQQYDYLILTHNKADLHNIERQTDMAIHTLDHLLAALDRLFQRGKEGGVVATKVALAYQRPLQFDYVTKGEAEKVFSNLIRDQGFCREDATHGISGREAKPLSDFLFHQVLQRTIDAGLPMQIHTGIQEDNGNYLAQTNPVLLTSVFMMYPEARFDIFHAGYPYWNELGVLAKMFPSVHADLCWTHVISPLGARRALSEWLELMPASKIFGFGGDYVFVEGAYVHSRLARENVARVLAEKVTEGYFTLDEANQIAKMILRENAKQFFGI